MVQAKNDNRYVAHWELQPGYVYFIGAGDPPVAVKIGISTAGTMARRLRQLQSSNHEPLSILGLIAFADVEKPMKQASEHELSLHIRFQASRRFTAGPGNEWFTVTEELLQVISDQSKQPEHYDLRATIATPGPGIPSGA